MRRPELNSIGRRLTQLRAPRSQKEQAKALGVPERTYQTYEQDNRNPDLRTLMGVFLSGWNLTWVLAGVGSQRIDPRAVIEYLICEKYPQAAGKTLDDVAHEVADGYKTGAFPVPRWVKDELPDLTHDEARDIAAGAWHVLSEAKASHDLSEDHLIIALELADDAIRAIQADVRPPRLLYGRLLRLIYLGVTRGLPMAEVRAIAGQAAEAFIGTRGGGHDSEQSVDSTSAERAAGNRGNG